jgi:hypothetical protein
MGAGPERVGIASGVAKKRALWSLETGHWGQFMNRRNPPPQKKRLVWRITESALQGEWVDLDAVPLSAKRDLPEVSSGGWTESSFDLLSGTEVSENPETVPDALFDELFRPKDEGPKNPPK